MTNNFIEILRLFKAHYLEKKALGDYDPWFWGTMRELDIYSLCVEIYVFAFDFYPELKLPFRCCKQTQTVEFSPGWSEKRIREEAKEKLDKIYSCELALEKYRAMIREFHQWDGTRKL